MCFGPVIIRLPDNKPGWQVIAKTKKKEKKNNIWETKKKYKRKKIYSLCSLLFLPFGVMYCLNSDREAGKNREPERGRKWKVVWEKLKRAFFSELLLLNTRQGQKYDPKQMGL